MKATTRLTLENERDGVLDATLEMTFANGESLRLNFLLPKKEGSQTLHEIEHAMLRRAQEVTAHMLQN